MGLIKLKALSQRAGVRAGCVDTGAIKVHFKSAALTSGVLSCSLRWVRAGPGLRAPLSIPQATPVLPPCPPSSPKEPPEGQQDAVLAGRAADDGAGSCCRKSIDSC